MTKSLNNMDSPIVEFYSGKSILVTGATGFIGKVLIEKLLYSCADVDKIYLLIRGAKGKSPKERLLEMISTKPFDIRIKREVMLEKLIAIESDLAEPGLALSQQDAQTLADEISIIFHVAASVKFEAPLEVNMRHNVVATKELLNFACDFKKLECFVHVSTAYSNCQLLDIDERVYPMDVPEDPMSLVVTKEMIDNRPNTYTYTKAMAENVASKYASRINIVIVRPSIVMSSLKEPAQGWVDTINGPVGLSVLGALGVLQKIKVNSEVVFDLIPVDIVSNTLISIAWAATKMKGEFIDGSPDIVPALTDSNENMKQSTGEKDQQKTATDETVSKRTSGSVTVFNLTTGSENPCSFYHYFNTGRQEAYKKPSGRALRPLLQIPKQRGMNPIQYWIYKVFSHLLFAYIVDTLMGIWGQKKMVIKAVNRMHHANEVFDYFCSNQWNFATKNVKRLRQLQSDLDKRTFFCDVRDINWSDYARIGWIGCRRFILKESDDTIDSARARYRKICALYYLVKLVLCFAITFALMQCVCSPVVRLAVLIPIYSVVHLL